jgi:hypothetical protein
MPSMLQKRGIVRLLPKRTGLFCMGKFPTITITTLMRRATLHREIIAKLAAVRFSQEDILQSVCKMLKNMKEWKQTGFNPIVDSICLIQHDLSCMQSIVHQMIQHDLVCMQSIVHQMIHTIESYIRSFKCR